MKEHLNDYEKRIWEGINKDAEEIIKGLESDPKAMSVNPGEDLDQRIYAMIPNHDDADPEEMTMEGLSEEDREALRLGRELQKRRKEKEEEKSKARKRHRWKQISAAVAAVVLAIGIGTTGVGGPKRIVEIVEQTVGDRKVSKVNSSKKDAKTIESDEESMIYQQIKDQLGFDPVRIIATHEKMIYEYGEIDTDMQMAQLLYKNGNANISYVMSASYYEELMGADLEDDITDQYTLEEGKLNAEVTEYQLPDNRGIKYSAKFEYRGIYYQLTGTMEKDKFEKILKNLHFPA